MSRRTLLLLALFSGAFTAHAGELAIGGVTLSLGKERELTIRALQAASFSLSPNCSATASCLVFERKRPDSTAIGSVTFKDGRLIAASRQWGAFQNRVNPVQISKALLAALESAQAATGAEPSIKSQVQRAPGAEFTTLEFVFPGRRVSVLTTDGDSKYGQQVSISEFIQEAPK